MDRAKSANIVRKRIEDQERLFFVLDCTSYVRVYEILRSTKKKSAQMIEIKGEEKACILRIE